ncbi:hypothetical protein AA0473_1838 [Acetobacter orleanensis NRIC 0473]|nr:hypothetical protein AA0473_1838 [Acetobacter orleanensis NRIC 0473]
MFELSRLIEPILPAAAFYMTARTCQFVSAPLNLPVVRAPKFRTLATQSVGSAHGSDRGNIAAALKWKCLLQCAMRPKAA